MTDTTWKTIKQDFVFEALPYLRVACETVELPNGQQINDFYQVHLRPFVSVVPVTKDGRIMILEQYKHGPRRVSITFPGGFVDEGEEAEEAGRRELIEETGYSAGKFIPLGQYVDNGNQRGCFGSYFLALDCEKVTEADSGDLEDMEVSFATPEELDGALGTPRFAITHMAAAWAFARMKL
ncbi:NUDIX hydrolase [Marinovum sp. 2_MG-2023]|uniref:NUDIX hydrolase n=1 Tax=unclassified Marinovum TaxID=2647166 RepID=UPI0026E1BE60|nr:MULTISPECIES: NUDIX hydrolase [unclassified Marinovum]MDO6730439.1 NUDIX hydrolase [Marinovum sp. 2_MG-2023]MDO6778419.1 NUDIX hydrolase [Marinovum sp. 1_MG-2023]